MQIQGNTSLHFVPKVMYRPCPTCYRAPGYESWKKEGLRFLDLILLYSALVSLGQGLGFQQTNYRFPWTLLGVMPLLLLFHLECLFSLFLSDIYLGIFKIHLKYHLFYQAFLGPISKIINHFSQETHIELFICFLELTFCPVLGCLCTCFIETTFFFSWRPQNRDLDPLHPFSQAEPCLEKVLFSLAHFTPRQFNFVTHSNSNVSCTFRCPINSGYFS